MTYRGRRLRAPPKMARRSAVRWSFGSCARRLTGEARPAKPFGPASEARPFLAFVNRVLWKGTMPTVEFGRLGVYWTLDHTIKCAAGGIGGKIRIATLRKIDGKWAASEVLETEEPAQFISEIEAQIGSQALRVVEDAKASPPPLPPSTL